MSQFEHNGIKIEVSASGIFRASVGGKYITKPSLAAMKKFLDESAKTAFQPFDALVRLGWQNTDRKLKGVDLNRVAIASVATETGRRRFSRKAEAFFVDAAGRHHYTVYRDCPEAIEAAKACERAKEETLRLKVIREAEEEKLAAALEAFTLKAEDYKEGGAK